MLAEGAALSSSNHQLWLWGGACAGYLLMMWTNPARNALRDGWRAVRRYPRLWLAFGGLWFFHAIFRLAQRAYLHWLLPPETRPVFLWAREGWRDPELWLAGSPESLWWLPHAEFAEGMRESLPLAIEHLAGLFNCVADTFPFSAIAGMLLLCNWHGHRRTLFRALRKRFRWTGWLWHFAILGLALAAVAKPLAYIPPVAAMPWSQLIAGLSFGFEFLLGVLLQVWLILIANAWVRGIAFDPRRLFALAARRSAVVLKWAGLVLLLSSMMIDLPLILRGFEAFGPRFPEPHEFDRWLEIARMSIAAIVLAGAGIQVTLTLHTRSLGRAVRDYFRMLRRRGWTVGWFFLVAAFHLFAVNALVENVSRGAGEGTALWVAWRMIAPWFSALATGWLLASWVCLYKQCEHTRTPSLEPVRY